MLVYYARRLKETLEETDYLCRYAGDEFVVVSLRDEERALLLAENLSEEIRIGHIKVSASVGVFLGSKDREKLFSLSFREMITRASLFCTEIKKNDAPRILLTVRRYLKYNLSYRDLAENEIHIAHTTIMR